MASSADAGIAEAAWLTVDPTQLAAYGERLDALRVERVALLSDDVSSDLAALSGRYRAVGDAQDLSPRELGTLVRSRLQLVVLERVAAS